MRLRPPTAPAVLLLLGLATVLLTQRPGTGAVLVAVPLLLLAAPLVLPCLEVSAHGLVVTGVLCRHVVPWPAVDGVRQAWFVTLDLSDGRRITVLAVPVVASMLAFRTWSVGDDDFFLRDSTRRLGHPGAAASTAVELVLAHRPVDPRPREDTGDPDEEDGVVSTRWRLVVLVTGAVVVVGWLVVMGWLLAPAGAR